MKIRLALCLIGLVTVSSASAQEMPIVGVWQATSMGPPRSVATITYSPDGQMLREFAVAPQPGQGSGIVRTMGQYRMQGPTTVLVRFGPSEMCTAGLACGPAPEQLVPYPGSETTFDVTFRGSNQLVDGGGQVWVRIR